jgi:hypothetical protein
MINHHLGAEIGHQTSLRQDVETERPTCHPSALREKELVGRQSHLDVRGITVQICHQLEKEVANVNIVQEFGSNKSVSAQICLLLVLSRNQKVRMPIYHHHDARPLDGRTNPRNE